MLGKVNRIAIFQYQWLFQGYSRDLLLGLLDYNYVIDFFIDECSFNSGLVEPLFLINPGLNIHVFPSVQSGQRSFLHRVVTRIKHEILVRVPHPYLIIPKKDADSTAKIIKKNEESYLAFIGIEKAGLIFAGVAGKKFSIPIIYYSLELYFRSLSPNRFFQAQITLEQNVHTLCAGTIIQDLDRAQALFQHNGITSQPRILFPVSVPRIVEVKENKYWHDRFNLEQKKIIVLYFGNLFLESRELDVILDEWVNVSERYELILHGPGDHQYFINLIKQRGITNAHVSADLVKESELPCLISAADVSLCLYSNKKINDRLTAFSSQKLAMSLRGGVPIITRHNDSFQKLFSRYQCGLMLKSLTDLSEALDNLMKNAGFYSSQARLAFEDCYCFENNILKVNDFLMRL